MRGLAIAMIGQRDIPATYGGVERHVEELSARLSERGHAVTVFVRRGHTQRRLPGYRGFRLHYLPTVKTKHLDAIVHSALAATVASRRPFDVVHFHSLGPGLMAPLPRVLSHAAVVQSVHGLDDERAKWGGCARAMLRLGQWMSARVPDATLADAVWLADHYRTRYGREVTVVPNGVPPAVPAPRSVVADVVGDSDRYALFVGRFVPEKSVEVVISAWRRLDTDARLVLVGGSAFTDRYAAAIRAFAAEDPRVVLAGFRYGTELHALFANASVFVLPSEVEGLPLVLLTAAAFGVPVVASDIAAHREVLRVDGPGHRLVPHGDADALAAALADTLAAPTPAHDGARTVRAAVLARHDWDNATDVVESVYDRVVSRRPTVPVPR